jgi:hypothetical protein
VLVIVLARREGRRYCVIRGVGRRSSLCNVWWAETKARRGLLRMEVALRNLGYSGGADGVCGRCSTLIRSRRLIAWRHLDFYRCDGVRKRNLVR